MLKNYLANFEILYSHLASCRSKGGKKRPFGSQIHRIIIDSFPMQLEMQLGGVESIKSCRLNRIHPLEAYLTNLSTL